jgi:hypothetical protein
VFGFGSWMQLKDLVVAEVQSGHTAPKRCSKDDIIDLIGSEVHNLQVDGVGEQFEIKYLKVIVGQIEYFQLFEVLETGGIDVRDLVVGEIQFLQIFQSVKCIRCKICDDVV